MSCPDCGSRWCAGECNYGDDQITVCAEHLRFWPCRHGSSELPCRISIERNDIATTYLFQQGSDVASKYLEKQMKSMDS